jgi:Flp pilus assembly protein CpaB
MRRRRWRSSRSYFVASVVLSLAAGLILHSSVNRQAVVASAAAPEVAVVTAVAPISRGSRVALGEVRLARMPASYAPPGALTDASKAAGRVALADLVPGEVVTETRLARVRAGPVASLVPQGLRAFAVQTSLPARLVAPGDHVDVLATFNTGQAHTETVVNSVEVLLVLGRGAPPDGRGVPDHGDGLGPATEEGADVTTLVLLVSPDQQERLAFARAFANLEVTLAPAE